MTGPPVKPSVLRTAISVRRSRTAMLIVLAVTSRIVKVTARPMPLSSSARFPASEMKLARKAASVSVLVWASLFSNSVVDRLADGAGLARVVDLDDVGADADAAAAGPRRGSPSGRTSAACRCPGCVARSAS